MLLEQVVFKNMLFIEKYGIKCKYMLLKYVTEKKLEKNTLLKSWTSWKR